MTNKKDNEIEKDKFILDACCGCRMMWFNKHHPNCLYIDIRKEDKGFIKEQPNYEVNPDIIADFTKLPEEIKQKRFKLVVWDIPHFIGRKKTGVFLKKFGCLSPETWQSDIQKGFSELWNVLEDYGVLILKFSDYHIKFNKVLELLPQEPLFFNSMNSMRNEGNKSETRWFCFIKIPDENNMVSEFEKGKASKQKDVLKILDEELEKHEHCKGTCESQEYDVLLNLKKRIEQK